MVSLCLYNRLGGIFRVEKNNKKTQCLSLCIQGVSHAVAVDIRRPTVRQPCAMHKDFHFPELLDGEIIIHVIEQKVNVAVVDNGAVFHFGFFVIVHCFLFLLSGLRLAAPYTITHRHMTIIKTTIPTATIMLFEFYCSL